jgi:hypothetical protein
MLCKIIEGHGDVRLDIGTDAGPPLMVNAPIAPNWVNLPADGRFVVKDPRTARETTFRAG